MEINNTNDLKMKNIFLFVVLLLFGMFTLPNCRQGFQLKPKYLLSEEQKMYWYENKAEINSYALIQARYGETRKGKAVMVFVTEPFSPRSFTKADFFKRSNIPVLKLNYTKNFETGIYPYSMMASTFFPVDGSSSSVKITASCQEWCGHTFVEMKNRGTLIFDVFSYFEGENQRNKVRNAIPEDDIWSMIRLFPDKLPLGDVSMVPPMFYLRLMHKDTKAYNCKTTIKKENERTQYILYYPELDRKMTMVFENNFPYRILEWYEEYADGFGQKAQKLITSGKLLKSHKSAYWHQNGHQYVYLRDSLKVK